MDLTGDVEAKRLEKSFTLTAEGDKATVVKS